MVDDLKFTPIGGIEMVFGKKHILYYKGHGKTLCGHFLNRYHASGTQTITDFLDWGFNGNVRDLCRRCGEKAEDPTIEDYSKKLEFAEKYHKGQKK